jgi:hypothetical protein
MQQILTLLLNSTLTWITEPQTIIAITLFIIKLPNIIETFKKAKKEEYINIAIEQAKEISLRLLKANITNDEKREIVVSSVYKFLPPNSKKYISEDKMKELVNAVYHTYIKHNQEINNDSNKI